MLSWRFVINQRQLSHEANAAEASEVLHIQEAILNLGKDPNITLTWSYIESNML